jgi:hypothetical protein
LHRPQDPKKQAAMVEKMRGVASSPAVAIFGAGGVLANPGVFIPLALKTISELNPSRSTYFLLWTAFAVVSLLPLATAMVMLVVAHDWAVRTLTGARGWLIAHVRALSAPRS